VGDVNGPDHYRAAEGWLSEVRHDTRTPESSQALAAAQVHATLALAAAVGTLDAHAAGVSGAATGRIPEDAAAWRQATDDA
jgi:hypothetical protein